MEISARLQVFFYLKLGSARANNAQAVAVTVYAWHARAHAVLAVARWMQVLVTVMPTLKLALHTQFN